MNLRLIIILDAYIGQVRLDGHPRVFVRPIEARRDDAMLMTLEGKMNRLNNDIPSIRMDMMPIEMQEHVVGVPPAWLRLLRKVFICVIPYK